MRASLFWARRTKIRVIRRVRLLSLSVVIVNYNTQDLLAACLSSIFHNSSGIDLEVVVVDNGSSDGSANMVESRFPQVKLIRNRTNLYFTKANNQGIRASTALYVLVLNSDTLVLDGTLKKMLEFMEAHPEAGVMSCVFLATNGEVIPTCWQAHTLTELLFSGDIMSNLFPNSSFRQSRRMNDWDRLSLREVDVVVDACAMFRKQALDEVGLYDEAFLLYYTEDDICLRLHQAGWKVFHYPDAQIMHRTEGTVRRGPTARNRAIHRNDLIRYFSKYHSAGATLLISVVSAIDLSGVWLYLQLKRRRGRLQRRAAY